MIALRRTSSTHLPLGKSERKMNEVNLIRVIESFRFNNCKVYKQSLFITLGFRFTPLVVISQARHSFILVGFSILAEPDILISIERHSACVYRSISKPAIHLVLRHNRNVTRFCVVSKRIWVDIGVFFMRGESRGLNTSKQFYILCTREIVRIGLWIDPVIREVGCFMLERELLLLVLYYLLPLRIELRENLGQLCLQLRLIALEWLAAQCLRLLIVRIELFQQVLWYLLLITNIFLNKPP